MKYKKLPSYDTLMFTLRKTISTAWHINTIHEVGINKWLNNFEGDALCTKDFERCFCFVILFIITKKK